MFITPSLILLAFGGGLLLFLLGAVFLNVVFYEWLAPMAQPQSEAFWMLRGGLALAYAAFIYVLANVAFRGVSTFPALLSHWIDTRSLLPESVTINGGAGTRASSAPAQSGGGAMGVIGDVWSRVTGQTSRPSASQNGKAGAGGLTKTDQSPHFPHISEDRVAAARAEAKAKAQAFARAQSGETKAQAGAEAGAGAIAQSMSDLEIAMAKTIARQMPDLERGETKTPLTQKEEPKEKPNEPPKESRPQNEEPLPDDKNPYKINPDTHE
jgi:hypothetical protein